MTRNESLQRLRSDAATIRGFGVRSLHLFGSTARDEALPSSDVDLFVDDDDRLDLFALADLQRHLSELLARPVDVGTRSGLHPALKERIESEAIRVF